MLGLATLGGCPVPNVPDEFVAVSELGFDKEDNARDLNNYPWAMHHFTPDGSEEGFLYVGTGNSVVNMILKRIGIKVSTSPVYRLPEVRRYRPDQGPWNWERVFDYHDVENGDPQTSGFRAMGEYRDPTDGVRYLYAGTLGNEAALWRTATGAPGSWERVWSDPNEGSIRALQEHDGLLYIAVTHEFSVPPTPGELFASDGQAVWPITTDGFGDPNNTGIFSLASYNGWLYAGTINYMEGYEVWKLDGPTEADAAARPVIVNGGPSSANVAVGEMVEFQGKLYVPAVIFGGVDLFNGAKPRGADMVRLDPADNVEVVAGPGSVAGVGSGFGDVNNGYLWSLEVHRGELYCGTWHSASVPPILGYYLNDILRSEKLNLFKPVPDLWDVWTGKGAQLWVSADGANWYPVFTHGLGNPDHYGVRTMASVDDKLYVGLANIFDGLQVFVRDDAAAE